MPDAPPPAMTLDLDEMKMWAETRMRHSITRPEQDEYGRVLSLISTARRAEKMERALRPFADLLDTKCNGYESSADDEVVRSVGTLGRDYAVITVGDLRRARAALGETP